MTTRDDLIAAKALIPPEKWIKGDLERDGCFCAVGAARKAAGGAILISQMDDARFQRYSNAYTALAAVLPPGFGGISGYNDALSTTYPDIMAFFDRAIEKASSHDQ